MKFLCDRCKTRYSIGDDRVRGKILKIRCKNCNNVITVREGMPDAEAAEAATVPQRGKPTTNVPIGAVSNGAGAGGALGQAFASAMTKPPPALEEEWYVSIDGDQAGPFSLAEAQRWVAGKPYDAELHCWSEGFDDWLPVDKVSHFRGLRKKPAPAPVPPPLPRAATSSARVVMARSTEEEEPKPLFAATMASLERSMPSALPSITGRATPGAGQAAISARANGSPGAAIARAPAAIAPVVTKSGPTGAAVSVPRTIAKPQAVSKPAAKPMFDDTDSATQIETPPFEDEQMTAAEPVASVRRHDSGRNDAFLAAIAAESTDAGSTLPDAPPPNVDGIVGSDGDLDGDGELDIGEVSRVVKLADLVRNQSAPVARRTGPIVGGRVSAPRIAGTGSVASMPGAIGADGLADPALADPAQDGAASAVPSVSHRRGMIALMVGAVLLLGVAGVVVFFVVATDDETAVGGLGRGLDIDTTRPDDPVRRGNEPVASEPPQNPFLPKPPKRIQTPIRPIEPPPSDGKGLDAKEVEDMASKSSPVTQRCYLRAQRGADGILISDLKKLYVTVTVNGTGAVTDVQLSEHAASTFGKCISSSIRTWRFRETQKGITARLTMVFQGA